MPDKNKAASEVNSGAKIGTEAGASIGPFERRLTAWVLGCMAAGVLAGRLFPALPAFLEQAQLARISIPITVLMWAMIGPMMLKVDFKSLAGIGRNPKGLLLTWILNWLVKPFTMAGIASLFLCGLFRGLIPEGLANEYLAGAVLLGAAPCTAMVFVWSSLVRGDAAYTVLQVATNDLIVLVAFAPIVQLLLGISEIAVPTETLLLSVALFVAIPLVGGAAGRWLVLKRKGQAYFENVLLKQLDRITPGALLATLFLIFASQSQAILEHPLHLALISVPLAIQTVFIFALALALARLLRLPFMIAAPAGFIGASNFFELALAVAVALFGAASPAALATTAGVLIEVPVMLGLVAVAKRLRAGWERSTAKSPSAP